MGYPTSVRGRGYRALAMETLESNYQQRIVRIIKRRGGWCVPTTRLSPVMRGIPDLIVCYRGLSMFIECKGRRTPFHKLQQLQHERLVKSGAIVIIAQGDEGVSRVKNVLDCIDDNRMSASMTGMLFA